MNDKGEFARNEELCVAATESTRAARQGQVTAGFANIWNRITS